MSKKKDGIKHLFCEHWFPLCIDITKIILRISHTISEIFYMYIQAWCNHSVILYAWVKRGEKFANVDLSSTRYIWYSSCSTVLHFTYSIRLGSMSLSLSRFPSYSVKRRISSAVRNLQILFQLHPGKRSLSLSLSCSSRQNCLRYLENSSNRGAPSWSCKLLPSRQFVWKEHRGVKERKTEEMRDWERESERELHRRSSLEAGQVRKSPWRGSLLCNYHVLHN